VLVAPSVEAGRAAMEHYALTNYGLPLDGLAQIQAVIAGPPEVVAAGLQRYTEAGARHLVIRIGAPNLDEQLEQIERIAALRPLLALSTRSG
jgi:alkanesulfonate monooxygenase SsuD/methylene tetrahydromethanopterin reductase-like flavin-dependent oxidoreductase (luciferase family)